MSFSIDTPSAADRRRPLEVWEAAVRATHHFLAGESICYVDVEQNSVQIIAKRGNV